MLSIKRFSFIVLTLLLFLMGSYLRPANAQDSSSVDSLDIDIQNPADVIPRQYKILSLKVKGAEYVNKSLIPATSGLNEGDQITIPGESISEAIKRLHRTGLFSNVEIRQSQVAGDGIELTIIVEEQPRLAKYKLKGDIKRSHRKDLKEQIPLMEGFAITESSKMQAINAIERYYKKEGYWYTDVTTKVKNVDSLRNRVQLNFNIDPGEKLEVKKIQFKGNEQFEDGKLEDKIEPLKEDSWWRIFSKKLFKEEDFKEGKNNVISFYQKNGFRDARIVDDSVYTYEYKDDKEGIGVIVEVQEGPQYHVRNIAWNGNTVYDDETLTETLGFKKGDVFNKQKFEENLRFNKDNDDVTSLYHNIGYLFFRVQPEIEMVEGDSLDLNMLVYEDEIANVNEVSFSGNKKTHDDVVRRTLRTIPGSRYSRQAIMRTIRELGQLGYFKQKKIKPNLDPNQEEHTVDVSYQLDESQSTDNFELSGGFGGRSVGLILSARVNFNNFSLQNAFRKGGWSPIPSGDGQKLSLGAQVTGRGYRSYNFSFQEPWLFGRPNSFGISLSYDYLDYRNSPEEYERFSSSVSYGKRLDWPDDYFTQRTILNYQLYDISGSNFLAEGTSNILSIKEEIERNSLDNRISPTRGSKFTFGVEVAPPFPNFSQYYKLTQSYQNHITLIGDLVVTNSFEFGYVGFIGDKRKSDFKRFYLGGTPIQQRQSFLSDNIDLRGFPGGQTGRISPYVNGNHVGGRVYTKYALEMRYPAVNNEQVRLIPYSFFDSGNSYLDMQHFDPFNVKRATGVGMRIFMPILGLVDLSYGYRLDGIPGTEVNAGEWEFLFNIGAPF